MWEEKKHPRTAYFFWALGLFGILGLHHFYLGNRTKGILWLCTFGLFGVGAMWDLLTLTKQVRIHNIDQELKYLRLMTLENDPDSKNAIRAVLPDVL